MYSISICIKNKICKFQILYIFLRKEENEYFSQTTRFFLSHPSTMKNHDNG
jgi:hypothetical protein